VKAVEINHATEHPNSTDAIDANNCSNGLACQLLLIITKHQFAPTASTRSDMYKVLVLTLAIRMPEMPADPWFDHIACPKCTILK
jgi:hypothetical protein